MKPQTDDKSPPESYWKGFAKFQLGIFLTILVGSVSGILPGLLNDYFPRVGIYIFLLFIIIFAISVAITLLRALWKVFRPDDPGDLSLR